MKSSDNIEPVISRVVARRADAATRNRLWAEGKYCFLSKPLPSVNIWSSPPPKPKGKRLMKPAWSRNQRKELTAYVRHLAQRPDSLSDYRLLLRPALWQALSHTNNRATTLWKKAQRAKGREKLKLLKDLAMEYEALAALEYRRPASRAKEMRTRRYLKKVAHARIQRQSHDRKTMGQKKRRTSFDAQVDREIAQILFEILDESFKMPTSAGRLCSASIPKEPKDWWRVLDDRIPGGVERLSIPALTKRFQRLAKASRV